MLKSKLYDFVFGGRTVFFKSISPFSLPRIYTPPSSPSALEYSLLEFWHPGARYNLVLREVNRVQ